MSGPYLLLNPTLFYPSYFLSVCFLLPPSPATEVQEEDYSQLDPLISTMVESKYTRGIQAANVLLSLKLAGISDLSSEGRMTRQVEDDVTNNSECLNSGIFRRRLTYL